MYYDNITYGKNKMHVLQAENTNGMGPSITLLLLSLNNCSKEKKKKIYIYIYICGWVCYFIYLFIEFQSMSSFASVIFIFYH